MPRFGICEVIDWVFSYGGCLSGFLLLGETETFTLRRMAGCRFESLGIYWLPIRVKETCALTQQGRPYMSFRVVGFLFIWRLKLVEVWMANEC